MSNERKDGLSRKRKAQLRDVLYETQHLEALPEGVTFQAVDSVIPKSMTIKTDTVFELYEGQERTGILHVEYQSENVKDMALRMLGYGGNIATHYGGLPVYQYVIYLGNGACTMPAELKQPFYTYSCKMVAINTIPFTFFLNSPDPKRWPMAVLGNWQGLQAEVIVGKIMAKLKAAGITSAAEAQEILEELLTFGNMRKVDDIIKQSIRTMEPVMPHYRDTRAFKELREEYREEIFAKGKAEGAIEGKTEERFEIAKSMKADRIPAEQIAKYTGLSSEAIEKL